MDLPGPFLLHYSAPMPEISNRSPVLRALAGRVRHLRARRGFSRAELSRRSGLSVRYLARVENGEGNISLCRLEELALALDTRPDLLVRPQQDRGFILTLVGLRGAGKSTVGPLVAAATGVPFVEMDTLILEACCLPLDQLFELHGERYYRRLEREVVGRLVAEGRSAVLAAAGGVVNESETWALLREKTFVVWLQASAEEHWERVVAQGDRRPMADNPAAMEELRAMLAAREALYAQSDLALMTDGIRPAELARRIRAHWPSGVTSPA